MIQALFCHRNNPFVIGEFFFCGNFTLRPHILILWIVLINFWVQFYLVYKIWVHIPKYCFCQTCELNCT
jgi:hypothetical protein